MPELWLRKTFPKVEFANTNILSKRIKICLSREKLEELDTDSCDIYQKNNVDRYTERPYKPEAVVKMCLAMFLSLYEKDYKLSKEDNDSQPIELDEKTLNVNHPLELSGLPKNISLLSTEKMKLRRVKKVLRFYQPNKLKKTEHYAHHLLMLYLPYRNEEDLLTNNSYLETLKNLEVKEVVENNMKIFEPHGEMIDDAFLNFQHVLQQDPILDCEDAETEELIPERESDDEISDDEENAFSSSSSIMQPTVVADEDINRRVRSLNMQQRGVFEVAHSYASRHLKNLNSVNPVKLKQLCLFITGNAGTGKSFIVRLLFDHLTKLFSFKNPMREKVLLLAPTGISSINISGTTFYSALSIYPKCTSKQLPQLGSKKRDELRHKFSELQVVIIDEISMISQLSLEHK